LRHRDIPKPLENLYYCKKQDNNRKNREKQKSNIWKVKTFMDQNYTFFLMVLYILA